MSTGRDKIVLQNIFGKPFKCMTSGDYRCYLKRRFFFRSCIVRFPDNHIIFKSPIYYIDTIKIFAADHCKGPLYPTPGDRELLKTDTST